MPVAASAVQVIAAVSYVPVRWHFLSLFEVSTFQKAIMARTVPDMFVKTIVRTVHLKFEIDYNRILFYIILNSCTL